MRWREEVSDENIIDFTTANLRADIAAVKAESMRQAKVRWHLFEIMKASQIAPRALIRETLIVLITAPATALIEDIRCEKLRGCSCRGGNTFASSSMSTMPL